MCQGYPRFLQSAVQAQFIRWQINKSFPLLLGRRSRRSATLSHATKFWFCHARGAQRCSSSVRLFDLTYPAPPSSPCFLPFEAVDKWPHHRANGFPPFNKSENRECNFNATSFYSSLDVQTNEMLIIAIYRYSEIRTIGKKKWIACHAIHNACMHISSYFLLASLLRLPKTIHTLLVPREVKNYTERITIVEKEWMTVLVTAGLCQGRACAFWVANFRWIVDGKI